jgi:hypothetical protein
VGEAATSLWNFAMSKLKFKLVSPNGDKEKATPASTSSAQDDTSPVIGSSKTFLFS